MRGNGRGRLLAAMLVTGALAVGCGGGGGGDDGAVAETTATTAAEETTTTTTEAEETTTTVVVAPEAEDFIGEDIAEALEAFSDAGIDVEQVETIDESVPPGEIVDAEEQPDGSVVLTVSARPVTRFLDELQAVDATDGPRTPTFNVSGTTYIHGMWFTACSNTGYVEYDLGRDYRRLQATAGLLDTVESDVRVRLEILIDNEIVSTQDLGLGDTAAIDLDVTGLLRVRFQITPIAGRDCARVGFGDGKLIGVPSEVPPEGTG